MLCEFNLFSQNARVSYAQIVSGNAYDGAGIVYADSHEDELPLEHMAATLCPYIQTTITKTDGSISCRYGERCPYQHGDLCDICGSYCLHPTDQNQRKNHQKVSCFPMLPIDTNFISKLSFNLSGMHVNVGERYGAFICCSTIKRQNMWHLF